MITGFYTNNFRTYRDGAFVDFIASTNTEHRGSLIKHKWTETLPVVAFYGANASGKTTLVMAFNAAVMFIRNPYVVSNNGKIMMPHSPFIFDSKTIQMPTEYEITFIVGDLEFKIYFSVDNDKIIKENFSFKKINNSVFVRIYDRKGKVIYGTSNCLEKKDWDFIKECGEIAQENELIISLLIARSQKSKLFTAIKDFFYSISFIDEYSTYNSLNFTENSGLLNLYKGEEKEKHLQFIRKADPCITDIEARYDESINRYRIITKHKELESNRNVDFLSELESKGTLNTIAAYPLIRKTLENGGLLVADEIDSSIHPLLLWDLVNLFMNPNTNAKGAQLVCTLHNAILLDKKFFRRDQIWFVDKNDDGVSEIYSLNDITINNHKVRSDGDYLKQYIMGKFGAIPKIFSVEK